MQKLRVNIGNDFAKGQTLIVFLSADTRIKIAYNFYTGESKAIDEGEPVDDDFILKVPEHMTRPLFNALAEALDEQNIKSPNQHTIEGELNAKKEHLLDLQKMLKLKK